jgi:hypothetical protein
LLRCFCVLFFVLLLLGFHSLPLLPLENIFYNGGFYKKTMLRTGVVFVTIRLLFPRVPKPVLDSDSIATVEKMLFITWAIEQDDYYGFMATWLQSGYFFAPVQRER